MKSANTKKKKKSRALSLLDGCKTDLKNDVNDVSYYF